MGRESEESGERERGESGEQLRSEWEGGMGLIKIMPRLCN